MGKFKQSNSDQGSCFESDYCLNCRRYRRSKQTDDYYCRIRLYTFAYDIDDPEYPSEWIYQEDGSPTCTAFDDKRLKRIIKPRVKTRKNQLQLF